VSARGSSSIG